MTTITPLQQWGGQAPVNLDTTMAISMLVVYLLLMIGIGIVAGRYQTNEVDYYAAGRSAGILVISLSGFAAIASGLGTIGIPGTIYSTGVDYLIVAMIGPIGIVVGYWLLAKKMRLLGAYKEAVTAPDAMYYRFGEDDRIRLLGAISVFLGCIGFLAAQYAALGIVGSIILPFEFFTSLVLLLIVVGFYTVVGGVLAAIWSDAVQGAILVISSLLVGFYAITSIDGGLAQAVNILQEGAPTFLNTAFLGQNTILGIGLPLSVIILGITTAGQPHFSTKFYMIKKTSRLKWGAFIAAGVYLLSLTYWWAAPIIRAMVISGQVPEPSTPDAAIPVFVVSSMPEIGAAFVITAIVAAIMSTSNAFLNLAASSIQHDFIQEYLGVEMKDSRQVRVGRITTLLVLLLAFALAVSFPGLIFVLGAAGWAIFTAVLFPGIALAYNWKGATKEGVLWGGGIGMILVLFFAYGGTYYGISLPADFLGGQAANVIGILIFVVVSLVTSSEEYDEIEDKEIRDIIDRSRIGSRNK